MEVAGREEQEEQLPSLRQALLELLVGRASVGRQGAKKQGQEGRRQMIRLRACLEQAVWEEREEREEREELVGQEACLILNCEWTSTLRGRLRPHACSRVPSFSQHRLQQILGGGGGSGGGEGGAGASPFGGAPGANPFAAFGAGLGGGGGGAGGMFGGGGGGAGGAAGGDTRPPEERYASQLQSLRDMGFHDGPANLRALLISGGSVEGAISVLLGN